MMTQAYNDWHIDEWAASHPGRFIPLAIPPVWDPEALAAEVRRVAKKGCQAMTMPELPHIQGLPSYHDLDYWGPFFEAASEEHVVMCLHIGQGFGAINSAPGRAHRQSDHPGDPGLRPGRPGSPVGTRVPDLPRSQGAWSEAGIGWIPFYLNRCDRHYLNQRWLGHDFGTKLPSDIFRDHSLACYVTDPTALKVRGDIGIDIIAWECDYPHSDSIFPAAPEFVHAELVAAGCTDAEINKITWENTCRFFEWDPFRYLPRSEATVAALRDRSPDVDTTIRSKHEWRARYETAGAAR